MSLLDWIIVVLVVAGAGVFILTASLLAWYMFTDRDHNHYRVGDEHFR